jgi:hypothetical protein
MSCASTVRVLPDGGGGGAGREDADAVVGKVSMCVIRPEDGEKLSVPVTGVALVGRMRRALISVMMSSSGAGDALLLVGGNVLVGGAVLDVDEDILVLVVLMCK